MYDLTCKVAVVTGAAGRHGIGRAIALRLAQEGADVVITDIQASLEAIRPEDRQAGWQGLSSVVGEIESLGRKSLGLISDVSDATQVADMVGRTLDQFGKIDILVNNAGSRPGRDRVLVVDLEEDAFDEVMRVNVRGTYLCSKAVARHMIQRDGGGKIIIISSGAGKRAGILRLNGVGPRACSLQFVAGGHRILRLQVCPDRFHSVVGPRAWSPRHQRECNLSRAGGHRANGLYRSGPGV